MSVDFSRVPADDGLCRSTDSGDSWTPVATGLFSLRSVCPIGGQQLVAVGWRGVSFSSDGGDSWELVNQGLWPSDGRAISIDSLGYLYVGMANGGVFKSTVSTGIGGAADLPLPGRLVLLQNYPNPFNPTTIRYGLLVRSHVTLSIFNVLGEEIAALENGEKDAGYHEVKLDGRGLSSGVYLYRIRMGSFSQTRRLVLLR
jgi:hypothetical protein